MWVELTEGNVKTRLPGPELAMLSTAHLAPGQQSPLCEIIAGVVAEVRGHVGACATNVMDTNAAKIPKELEQSALTLIRWRLLGRLPNTDQLINEARRKDYDTAISNLRAVSDCKMAIATDATPLVASGGSYGGDDLIVFP